MKRKRSAVGFLAVLVSCVMLCGCGKSKYGVDFQTYLCDDKQPYSHSDKTANVSSAGEASR